MLKYSKRVLFDFQRKLSNLFKFNQISQTRTHDLAFQQPEELKFVKSSPDLTKNNISSLIKKKLNGDQSLNTIELLNKVTSNDYISNSEYHYLKPLISDIVINNAKLLSMEDIIILLKAYQGSSYLPNFKQEIQEDLQLLTQRFIFLAANSLTFEKYFSSICLILESLSLIEYRVKDEQFLSDWYQFTLQNLKFLPEEQMCRAAFICSFQIPEKKEIMNQIRLQLFRPTTLYWSQFLKTKYYVNPNDFKTVPALIKHLYSKMLLSSYERKGIYWEKDMDLRPEDGINLLRAYYHFKEYDQDFLALLLNHLEESFQNDLEKSEREFLAKYQKIFSDLLIVLSKICRKVEVKSGQDVSHCLEIVLRSVLRSLNQLEVEVLSHLCQSLSLIPKDFIDQRSLGTLIMQIHHKLLSDVQGQLEIKGVLYQECFIRTLESTCQITNGHFLDNQRQEQLSMLLDIWTKFQAHLKKSAEILFSKSPTLISRMRNIVFGLDSHAHISTQHLIKTLSNLDLNKIKLDVDVCWSLLKIVSISKDQPIQKVTKSNFIHSIQFLIHTLEAHDLNQTTLSQFFEIYSNLKSNNYLAILSQDELAPLTLLRNSLLRFLADHFKTFEIQSLEKIITDCIQSDLMDIHFDDASGLYDKTLKEEMEEFLKDNFKKLSKEFQAICHDKLHIQPDDVFHKLSKTITET